MRKSIRLAALAAALVAFAGAAVAAPFTPGNIVVVRLGDGATALSNAAAPVDLLEYTSAGVLVQTVSLPTTTVGPNFRCLMGGTAASAGSLNLSVDGQYLTFAGYDAAAGTANPHQAGASAQRIIARIAADGTVDTSTALTYADNWPTDNIRSVITTNGTDFWAAGTGTAALSGVRYFQYGATTSTRVSSTPTNMRSVGIFGGNLYCTSGSGTPTTTAVNAIGTGLPTAADSATTTPVHPGASGVGTASPYNFVFADANTLYVADDRTTANGGGIQKWTFSGTWSLAYTISAGAGVISLTGRQEGPDFVLYGTTTAAAPNSNFIRVADTGVASTPSSLALGGANYIFRGVAFAPVAAGPVDTTPPEVASVAAASLRTIDVTFDEPMGAGVTTAANYTVSGAGIGTLDTNPDSVALESGNTYRLTWDAPQEMFNGATVTVTVANAEDAAGNAIAGDNSGNTTGIGIAPTAGFVRLDPATTDLDVVRFEVTFSESVGMTFTAADITVGGTLPSGATVTSIDDTDPVYVVHVTMTDPNDEGEVNITIGTDVFDLALNPFAGDASPFYTISTTPPMGVENWMFLE